MLSGLVCNIFSLNTLFTLYNIISIVVQSIRDLQCSVRDGILLLKALLEEIERNAEQEKHDISSLYDAIQATIAETRDTLVQEIDRWATSRIVPTKMQSCLKQV